MFSNSGVDLAERRPGGETRRGAPPRGARTLTALLPNGRSIWFTVDPPLAPAGAVRHVAHLAEHAVRRRRAVIRSESAALAVLRETVAADAIGLSHAGLRRAATLGRRLVAGDNALDRRLEKAANEYRARIERQIRIERESVRRLGRRDLWDAIVLATCFPLFAAYGQRGRPFGANNLALTLSALIWLVGEEIVDALFGPEEQSPYPLRDADAWSYVAPIGNVLAGWWLLHRQQHERFIAGRVAVPVTGVKALPYPIGHKPGEELVYRYTARTPLSGFIAPAHFRDFETFTNVPAVATIAALTWSAAGKAAHARVTGLTAGVEGGELIVTVTAAARGRRRRSRPQIVDALDVAWMVDTAKPAADRAV